MLKCIISVFISHDFKKRPSMRRTRTCLASSHLKTLKIRRSVKCVRRAIQTRARFCSHYFPDATWRQNENRTRQSASALYADLGFSKPSAFDKVVVTLSSWPWRMCPCCRIIFGIGNEKNAAFQDKHSTDGAIASQPHEWLMSVHGDFAPFPHTIIQPVHWSPSVCMSPVAVKRSPDARRTPRLVLPGGFWKAPTFGWKEKMKSERQLRFLTLSVSHSAR